MSNVATGFYREDKFWWGLFYPLLYRLHGREPIKRIIDLHCVEVSYICSKHVLPFYVGRVERPSPMLIVPTRSSDVKTCSGIDASFLNHEYSHRKPKAGCLLFCRPYKLGRFEMPLLTMRKNCRK